MGSYKKIGLSHEMGLIDTPPLWVYVAAVTSEVGDIHLVSGSPDLDDYRSLKQIITEHLSRML